AIARPREDDRGGDTHRWVGVVGERDGSVEHGRRHRPLGAERPFFRAAYGDVTNVRVGIGRGGEDGVDGFVGGRDAREGDDRLEAYFGSRVGESAPETFARATVADLAEGRNRHLTDVRVVVLDGEEQGR